MPNLPAQTPLDFLNDIQKTIELKPDFVRLYPCLVVEGTKLATMYKEKIHTAWEMEATISLLAQALFLLWQANIPVIRIGVAPEEEFYAKVIAGVHHKALGQIVQSKALELCFKKLLEENNISNAKYYTFKVPIQSKGYLMLSKSSFYKEHSISSQNINFYDGNEIQLV